MIDLLVVAALLLGFGVGGALYRSNLVMILVSIQSAITGVILAVCSIGAMSEQTRSAAHVFALTIAFAMCMITITGYVLFFSRFKATKQSDINASIELRQ